MTGTVARFQQISRNIERTIGNLAQRPDVRRESDHYLANIRSVKSADDLLKNDRLYNFAMTAFGLKDMIYGKAFMRKVLTEGLDGPKSFALQLADPRFREFAEAFNFARYGGTATAFDREAGRSDEGLRLALYFQRKAPEVSSIFGLMGDPALYKVIQTVLGLPASYSNTNIDTQAAFIRSRINVEDFESPAKLDAFITRFAARWQAANGSGMQSAPVVGLSRSMLTSFDNSLLLSMQLLRGVNR